MKITKSRIRWLAVLFILHFAFCILQCPAQPVPATTSFSRYWLTSTNQAEGQRILGVNSGGGSAYTNNPTGLPGTVLGLGIGTNLTLVTNGLAQSEIVNVVDYGAVPHIPSGITEFSYITSRYSLPDNGAAIQAAFDAAYNSNGRSNTVFFPKGIYQCGTNIYVPPGINVRGVGLLHAGDWATSPHRLNTNAYSILWMTNSSASSLCFSNLNTKGSHISFMEINGYTNPLTYAKGDAVNSMATNTSANLATGPGMFLGAPSVTDWNATASAGEGYSGDFQAYNSSVVGFKVGVKSTANSCNFYRFHMVSCDVGYATSPNCCGADQTVFNNCSAALRSDGIGYQFQNSGAARGITFLGPSDYQIGTWIQGTNFMITAMGGNMEFTATTTRTNFIEAWGSAVAINMVGTRVQGNNSLTSFVEYMEDNYGGISGGLYGCRIQDFPNFASAKNAGIPTNYPCLLRTSTYDTGAFAVYGRGVDGWRVIVNDRGSGRQVMDAFPLNSTAQWAPYEAQPNFWGAYAWDNMNVMSSYGTPWILKGGDATPDSMEIWLAETRLGPIAHRKVILGDATSSTSNAAPNTLTLTALNNTGGVITNNGLIWHATNTTPTLALPNGSIATTTAGVLYIRTNGAWSQFSGGGGGDALVANPLSQFSATTSAQLRGVLTDESGTGAFLTTNGNGSQLTLDASGFNGNLATTDDTLQEVAQKLDDLVTGGGSGLLAVDTNALLYTTNLAARYNTNTLRLSTGPQSAPDEWLDVIGSAGSVTPHFSVGGSTAWWDFNVPVTNADAVRFNSVLVLDDAANLQFASGALSLPASTFTGNVNATSASNYFSGDVYIGNLYCPTQNIANINTTNMALVGQSNGVAYVRSDGSLVATNAPVITTIELGAASDTTLARSSAGNVSIEGNVIYRAGGTDVAVADGGTGIGSGTSGGVLGFTASGTIASSAALAANAIVIGGGAGATPTTTTTGAGVLTTLGIATNTPGGIVTQNGPLGTPSSGSAANLTGYPIAAVTSPSQIVTNGASFAVSLNGSGITNISRIAPTNTFTINTAFPLGSTNMVLSAGSVTGGITGIANGPTSGSGWGEGTIRATGTFVFTNAAAIRASDGLTSRTITNGTYAEFAIKVIAGLRTNMAIVQFP